MRFPAQLLSVEFSPGRSTRFVGTSNGTFSIGEKKSNDNEKMDIAGEFGGLPLKTREKVLRCTDFRYFRRGRKGKPIQSDFVVKRPAKVKLAEHDKLLKKFRHKDAPVCALNGKSPMSIVAVMEELVAMRKLPKCVANFDVDELGLLLGFLQRYATMPRYARFLMGLAKTVLELRGEDVQSSEELRRHVRNLKRMGMEEIRVQHSLQEIQGMVSPFACNC